MTDAIEHRQYQVDAINVFFAAVREGKKRVMLCAPTGSGKLVMSVKLLKHLAQHGKRVNFIVDRTALLEQTSEEFHRFGVEHGVTSGHITTRHHPIMVRSTQSMRARGISAGEADLNIVDEGHIVHKHIAAQMDEGTWLGLSATPFRKGLANLYDTVLNVATTDALQRDGYLAPLRIYSGVPMEVSRKTSSGEYDLQASAEEATRIVGNVIEEWEKHTEQAFGGPVKTIGFSNTVEDGKQIAAEFRGAGYDFHAVSYLNEYDEKMELIRALKNGEITGLLSAEMLQRGFDVKDILCGIDCHPWRKSLSAVEQQAGRARRTAPGKEFALWLDFAQNMLRFRDRLTDFWANGIDELVPMDNKAGEDAPERRGAFCPQCEALLIGPECRACGWTAPKPQGGGQPTNGTMCVDGELVPLEPGDHRQYVAKIGRKEYELPAPKWGWQMLCHLATERGKSGETAQRWCQANHRKLYGEFHMGQFDNTLPVAPDRELRVAVEHGTKLYVDGLKRQHRKRRTG